MSGHSKWAGIKHKKAIIDARRGKTFAKRLRGIEVAAREGGGKIETNPTLADAVARARDDSIPTDTIMRAIRQEGAEDLSDQGDLWQVTSAPSDLPRVRAAIEEAGLPLESAQITMEPSTTIELDRAGAGPVLKLLDALEELDDVQEVHSNFDLPDDVMAELAAG